MTTHIDKPSQPALNSAPIRTDMPPRATTALFRPYRHPASRHDCSLPPVPTCRVVPCHFVSAPYRLPVPPQHRSVSSPSPTDSPLLVVPVQMTRLRTPVRNMSSPSDDPTHPKGRPVHLNPTTHLYPALPWASLTSHYPPRPTPRPAYSPCPTCRITSCRHPSTQSVPTSLARPITQPILADPTSLPDTTRNIPSLMTTPPSPRLVAGHPVPTTRAPASRDYPVRPPCSRHRSITPISPRRPGPTPFCAIPNRPGTDYPARVSFLPARLPLPTHYESTQMTTQATTVPYPPDYPAPSVPPRRCTARSDYPLRHNTCHPTADTPCPSAPTTPLRANASSRHPDSPPCPRLQSLHPLPTARPRQVLIQDIPPPSDHAPLLPDDSIPIRQAIPFSVGPSPIDCPTHVVCDPLQHDNPSLPSSQRHSPSRLPGAGPHSPRLTSTGLAASSPSRLRSVPVHTDLPAQPTHPKPTVPSVVTVQ
jgi:hypothetical protein